MGDAQEAREMHANRGRSASERRPSRARAATGRRPHPESGAGGAHELRASGAGARAVQAGPDLDEEDNGMTDSTRAAPARTQIQGNTSDDSSAWQPTEKFVVVELDGRPCFVVRDLPFYVLRFRLFNSAKHRAGPATAPMVAAFQQLQAAPVVALAALGRGLQWADVAWLCTRKVLALCDAWLLPFVPHVVFDLVGPQYTIDVACDDRS